MSILRWKGQSLQVHRFMTGPDSGARRHGIFPRYAQLALSIARVGARVAGFAKKAWINEKPEHLDLDRLRIARAEINHAFDKLEELIQRDNFALVSAIEERHVNLAEAVYQARGNLGILALGHIEEAGELAEPLHLLATGQIEMRKALPQIENEAADVRIYLHITSEAMRICAESTTGRKWAEVRERFPDDAFVIAKTINSETKAAAGRKTKKAA